MFSNIVCVIVFVCHLFVNIHENHTTGLFRLVAVLFNLARDVEVAEDPFRNTFYIFRMLSVLCLQFYLFSKELFINYSFSIYHMFIIY